MGEILHRLTIDLLMEIDFDLSRLNFLVLFSFKKYCYGFLEYNVNHFLKLLNSVFDF